MAPYSGTAAVLLVVVISVVFGSKPVGNLGDLETGVLAPERNKHQPDEIRITGYGAGYGGWRTIVYSLLFIDGGDVGEADWGGLPRVYGGGAGQSAHGRLRDVMNAADGGIQRGYAGYAVCVGCGGCRGDAGYADCGR